MLAALAPACELSPADGQRLDAEALRTAWAVDGGAALRTGEHFALILRACPADAQLVRVDATMPAHRHGMNYRPGIEALGGGRWRVQGLMLHMAGHWELRMDWRVDARPVTLRQDLDVP